VRLFQKSDPLDEESSPFSPKLRTPSAKMRIDLTRLEIGRANQVKAGAIRILPNSRAMSRKQMFCDRLITKTDKVRQLHLLPLFPPLDEEECHRNPPAQKVWK